MVEGEMINLMIACAISADNNLDNVQRRKNIQVLKMMLNDSMINKKLTPHHKMCINGGIELLEKEIKDNG